MRTITAIVPPFGGTPPQLTLRIRPGKPPAPRSARCCANSARFPDREAERGPGTKACPLLMKPLATRKRARCSEAWKAYQDL
jgi:hypothetical protein